MYSVEHDNIFIALEGNIFGLYDHHRANAQSQTTILAARTYELSCRNINL